MDFCQDQLCLECDKEMRELFLIVKEYLQDHPGASIQEIVTSTEVDEKAVIIMLNKQWVSRTSDNDDDQLHCSSCGILIHSGKLCARCTANAQERLRGIMDGMSGKDGEQRPGQAKSARTPSPRARQDISMRDR